MEAASFAHAADNLFSDVSINLARGSITALIGANGVGKTTLAYLMMGLFRPRSGRLCADGVPFDDLDIEFLRGQIGFVMEQPWIFAGTVRENVAYGRPDATDREVEEACATALAEQFIAALPGGLDTRIGEGGVSLSGGQSQRIAIARALLSNPAVLILDEPTSHLDAHGVAALFANLRALSSRPAIFLITHDPALAALADHICELRDGRLLSVASAPLQLELSKGLST
jgi:ABC-type multidrug transport system fused ATPase/permease subunit